MDALLNLPTRDASNFAKYKLNSTDRQQLALHKQVSVVVPADSECAMPFAAVLRRLVA